MDSHFILVKYGLLSATLGKILGDNAAFSLLYVGPEYEVLVPLFARPSQQREASAGGKDFNPSRP